jgi:site-specific recombinase XerD
MQVRTFIIQLKQKGINHPCFKQCADNISGELHPEKAYLKVVTYLYAIPASQTKLGINYPLLKKLTGDFARNGREQYDVLRDILEVILLYAKSYYGINSNKVPVLLEVKQDKPYLVLNEILYANFANRIFQLLEFEQSKPSVDLTQLERLGRLTLFLYFKTCVKSLQVMSQLLYKDHFYFVGNLVYLQADIVKADGSQKIRYLLDDFTALLLMSVLPDIKQSRLTKEETVSDNESKPHARPKCLQVTLNNRNLLRGCNLFLSRQFGSEVKLTVSQLKSFRRTSLTLKYSPVEVAFFSGDTNSQILSDSVLYRLLNNKYTEQQDSEHFSSDRLIALPDFLNKTNKEIEYTTIAHSLILLKPFLSQLRKQSNKNKLALKIVHAYLEKNTVQKNFYVQLLICWSKYMLLYGGVRKRVLRAGTVADYIGSIQKQLLLEFSEYNFFELDCEDIIDKLQNVANSVKSPPRKACAYYFGKFFIQAGLVPDLPIELLDIETGTSQVDANIISVEQAENILTILDSDKLGVFSNDAVLVFCLGFYTGLRRGELMYLQVQDFEILKSPENLEINLTIKPNSSRIPKSHRGRRLIPLSVLWPKKWLRRLEQKLAFVRDGQSRGNKLLFPENKVLQQILSKISEAMRRYLNDPKFRFHNLRHSFANWQYFRLVVRPQLLAADNELPGCIGHEYFSLSDCEKLQARLALLGVSRKKVHALATLLGHVSSDITFASYIHLRDYFIYLHTQQHCVINQTVVSRLFARATLDESTFRESLIEAIDFRTQGENSLMLPNVAKVLHQAENLTQNFELEQLNVFPISTMKTAEMLGKLANFDPKIVAQEYMQIELWVENLKQAALEVSKLYSPIGKKLPPFPSLPNTKKDYNYKKDASLSRRELDRLFGEYDKLRQQSTLTLRQIDKGLEMMHFIRQSNNYAFFCSDREVIDAFVSICIKLNISKEQFQFKVYFVDQISYKIGLGQKYDVFVDEWVDFISQLGFDKKAIQYSWLNEYQGKYYGDSIKKGKLEIRLVNRFESSGKSKRMEYIITFFQVLLILRKAEKMTTGK